MTSPDDLVALAADLARRAGTLALDGRRALGPGAVDHRTKSTATDPVTEFDRAAERLIVDEVRSRCPADSIVGEEGADHRGTSSRAWLIDPIDGTANFVYDLPMWCTSIGVVDEHGGLAAAVYAPVTDELFTASRGQGARLNDVPIRCSSPADLATSMVGTGFSYDPVRRARQGARVAALVPLVRDIRRFGSAALDVCMVACGRLDAYFEEHLNAWDLAAGLLIASEAGAASSDFTGGPARPDEVVVAAPSIHAALRTTLVDLSR